MICACRQTPWFPPLAIGGRPHQNTDTHSHTTFPIRPCTSTLITSASWSSLPGLYKWHSALSSLRGLVLLRFAFLSGVICVCLTVIDPSDYRYDSLLPAWTLFCDLLSACLDPRPILCCSCLLLFEHCLSDFPDCKVKPAYGSYFEWRIITHIMSRFHRKILLATLYSQSKCIRLIAFICVVLFFSNSSSDQLISM